MDQRAQVTCTQAPPHPHALRPPHPSPRLLPQDLEAKQGEIEKLKTQLVKVELQRNQFRQQLQQVQKVRVNRWSALARALSLSLWLSLARALSLSLSLSLSPYIFLSRARA